VPALLRAAADKTFYRSRAASANYLGTDGAYHDVQRPDGVLLLEDIKLAAKPVLKNASRGVGHRRRRAVLRVHQQSNSLDDQIIALLGKTIALVKRSTKPW
jgi:3-hydroxyacyl-CoA dehydrogenase